MTDPIIKQAYAEVAKVRGWERERESPRWKLAQATATNRLPLNGPGLLKHATNPQAIGKRKVVKKVKT